jgi:predicted GNAT family N-acyltransferase
MAKILPRPCQPADHPACLALFDSNQPTYFAATERVEFTSFLHSLSAATPYLVLTRHGRIVACGGLRFDPARHSATLCWGMVARPLHGQGLGTRLTTERIALTRAIPGLSRITLSTSQHTRGFYQGFGFHVDQIIPNGFGHGLDRCDMSLSLARD